MVRVAYVTHATEVSGAELSLIRLLTADAFESSGVQSVVVVPSGSGLTPLLQQAGLEVHEMNMGEAGRGIRKDDVGSGLVRTLRACISTSVLVARLGMWARRNRVNVIHSNSMKAHIFSVPVARVLRIPLIWHVRDTVDQTYLPARAVLLVRAIGRIGPSCVVAVSQSVLDSLALPVKAAKVVIHDGLGPDEVADFARAATSRQAAPGGSGALTIGMVGRLAPWKGQHIAVEAVRLLKRRGVAVKLLIAGAPLFGNIDYGRKIESLVSSEGLDSEVVLLGPVADVPNLLAGVDVLIHASISADPLPGVVLEGMAAGLPVVASYGGGVPEMVIPGVTGLLVPMGDASALADALQSLADAPELREHLGRAGQLRVAEAFMLQSTVSGLLAVYESVLKGKATAIGG